MLSVSQRIKDFRELRYIIADTPTAVLTSRIDDITNLGSHYFRHIRWYMHF